MSRKHTIVRAARDMRIEGINYEPGDCIGHLLSEVAPETLGGMLARNRGMISLETRDSEEELEDESEESQEESGELREASGEEGQEESGEKTQDAGGESQEASGDDRQEPSDPPLAVDASLTTSGLSDGVVRALSVTAVGDLPAEDLVPDHTWLATTEGIAKWHAKHGDLTQIFDIGKNRAKEIASVLNL